jgi:pyrroline-5-carboxylate reductase
MSSILLLGGGRMGGALLRGWLASGTPAAGIAVIDVAPSDELRAEAASKGFALNPPLDGVTADTVVVAVKPQKVTEICDIVTAVAAPGSLLVSIMAGKTLADLAGLFPATSRIIRAMPNLPAAVGRGMTVAVASPDCSPADRTRAERLLAATGAFEWLPDEALIDAATGLSGSGPAYVFYFTECLTEAGVRLGLAPELAARLARATVEGSGAMLEAGTATPERLRADVTSPAGTTEAALRVLMADGVLADLVGRTVAAAARRARELAG